MTGANSGIGMATAFELAKYNPAQICIAARNVAGGHAAVAELKEAAPKFDVRFVECGLANFESISRAAKEVIGESGRRLDVLILNAGIVRILSLSTCFQPIIMFPDLKGEPRSMCASLTVHMIDGWPHRHNPPRPRNPIRHKPSRPRPPPQTAYSSSPCHGREKCQLPTPCHIPQLKRSRSYRYPSH
jgi:hypothetical protein